MPTSSVSTFAKMLLLATMVLIFSSTPALADQFNIGNTVLCPNSNTCSYIYPPGPSANEVIAIGQNSLTMYNHSGQTIGDDFLLIIGVPNQNGGTIPTISSITASTLANVLPGGIHFTAPLYTGQMKSGQDACQVAIPGIKPGQEGDCNSESYTNWAGADSQVLGITVNPGTGFAIFAYDITGVELLAPDGYITVNFSSGLGVGDFAVAYGCPPDKNIPCKSPDSTPFTQSGLVRAPEPASVALLGFGLLGLAACLRRRIV